MKAVTVPVPFVDLKTQCNELTSEIMPAIENVIRRAAFILGAEVDEFEEKFADYCDSGYCVSVASGTDAIHLALRAVGVGPGDEVITAGNSFVATTFAISHTGATPVLVDITPADHNLNVNLIEQAISPKTKAIIPVHLYGQPGNMQAIQEIAEKHGLKIVEDSCQAHGSEYFGKRTGTLGDAGCFSFYPGKNLGAFGDGGAIVTQDPKVAERKAAALYHQYLADSELVLPTENEGARHVYHLFVVKHPQRKQLMEYLNQQDIFCGIHYPNPLNQATPYLDVRSAPNNLPVCTKLADEIFSLPMFPGITESQIQRVSKAIKSFDASAH